jgi:hypothetical protein
VTPARRVLLLIALVLVIVPGGVWTWTTRSHEVKIFAFDFHFYGGLLMFVLLILEVADRVVIKRDLQIAKEIQAWLSSITTTRCVRSGDRICHAASQYCGRRLLRRLCPPLC